MFDFVSRRSGIFFERGRDRHHHPGRAEAALLRVLFDECGLDRMHIRGSAETFDSRDLMTARVDRSGNAGDAQAVDTNRQQ